MKINEISFMLLRLAKYERLIITIADAELEKHAHFTFLKEDKNVHEGKNVKRKCEL